MKGFCALHEKVGTSMPLGMETETSHRGIAMETKITKRPDFESEPPGAQSVTQCVTLWVCLWDRQTDRPLWNKPKQKWQCEWRVLIKMLAQEHKKSSAGIPPLTPDTDAHPQSQFKSFNVASQPASRTQRSPRSTSSLKVQRHRLKYERLWRRSCWSSMPLQSLWYLKKVSWLKRKTSGIGI